MTDSFRAGVQNSAFKRRFHCKSSLAEQAAELFVAGAAGAQLE
jgi:hypothetical protein